MFANIHKTNGRKNDQPNSSFHQIRIGDRVQNGRYGRGVVQGRSPDGTLVVRFDRQNRSYSVFPTLLERMDR